MSKMKNRTALKRQAAKKPPYKPEPPTEAQEEEAQAVSLFRYIMGERTKGRMTAWLSRVKTEQKRIQLDQYLAGKYPQADDPAGRERQVKGARLALTTAVE